MDYTPNIPFPSKITVNLVSPLYSSILPIGEWEGESGGTIPQRITALTAYKLIAAGCHTYTTFYGKHLACI